MRVVEFASVENRRAYSRDAVAACVGKQAACLGCLSFSGWRALPARQVPNLKVLLFKCACLTHPSLLVA